MRSRTISPFYAVPVFAARLFESLDMPNGKQEAIRQLKKQFWEATAKADALRNLAATQRNEQDSAHFIQRAQLEEDKAKGILKQIEILEKSEL
jgi:hypothetical protein